VWEARHKRTEAEVSDSYAAMDVQSKEAWDTEYVQTVHKNADCNRFISDCKSTTSDASPTRLLRTMRELKEAH